jgi:ABC-type nickel/cobalt efflux system permease component RcnA
MSSTTVLILTAVSIGFLHTLFGPDHYIPFIVISRARNWSKLKTVWVTLLCGVGHVLSSVVLGIVGIIFGIAVGKLEIFEGFRGNIASWVLIAFGLVYTVWGIRNAIINKPHSHPHFHKDGTEHEHPHTHNGEHAHIHTEEGKTNITPWVLFIIFVLGPCEPLIPLLMYPASQGSMWGLILVTIAFSIVTILTMTTIVMLFKYGFDFLKLGRFERYTHAVAGSLILFSGLAIQFLGL